MFVARRAFRNYNQMIAPGSIVEPGTVKWFKTRLRDRVIVEVTETNLDRWEEYFVGKLGVSIKANLEALDKKAEEPEAPKAEEPEAPKAEEPEAPKAEEPEAPKAEEPKKIVAKAVIK